MSRSRATYLFNRDSTDFSKSWQTQKALASSGRVASASSSPPSARPSAVGIGSIWKFPYEVGSNGGGAFVAFYIAGLALIVVPLMLAEFAIGRQGAGDPVTRIATVARAYGSSRA